MLGMYFAFNYDNIMDLFSNIKNKIIIITIGVLITIYYIIEVYLSIHFNVI